ncbi:MAG: ATP-binding protein, partial [Thermocrispum sp.]
RILRNLVANAVDHSEGLPVRVTMAVTDDAVAVTVRDYGVGLRPGEEELVFNRFWRADPSRNRHTGGTGLGLAISHEDARLHGGELAAWGEPGEGACFRLTLPREQGTPFTASPLGLPPDPPAAPPVPPAAPATGNGQHAPAERAESAEAADAAEARAADREEVGR